MRIGFDTEESSETVSERLRLFSFSSVSLKSNLTVYVPAAGGVHVTDLAVPKSEITEVPPLAFVTENL